MRICKIFYIIIFSFFITTLYYGQTYFEGKVVSDITYSNTPENMKNALNPTQSVWYYKKNKNRCETNSFIKQGDKSISFTSAMIFDFMKGEWLMLMDMPSYKTKTATLHNISKVESQKETIEKLEEYKDILGHKCQKIIITSFSNNTETKLIGYADFNYKINSSIDIKGYLIDSPLFFELEFTSPSLGTTITKILSISEEKVDDNFFNLNPPKNYNLTDIRKTFSNTVIESNSPEVSQNYDKFSQVELELKLKNAIETEDFETADKLKSAIEKKKTAPSKYGAKTITELQDMLKIAVNKEEFETATELQEEIKKRNK